MVIAIGGQIAFDVDQHCALDVEATASDVIAAIEDDDRGLAPFLTLSASLALIAEFEGTGPDEPTWLTTSTDQGEIACLEDEG
ncbi:hypothetical protein EDD52_11512 [Primorskyibacter sedentarius]|uniref:Uncharacterized protein n=1 Tax=Primorskyibacter sedentarius TaxID=745311 RepID=A0A4R3J4L3_9RHOB|nr:hypothetical protein [Primorskyibacter sedentarius]TCS60195.1 hypothetical protein EDD52_11512 [Primorskyibacter sedentarius]